MRDYSLESIFVKQLDEDILGFIHGDDHNENRFTELALREFELQFNTIEQYREYCKKKSVTPESAKSWRDVLLFLHGHLRNSLWPHSLSKKQNMPILQVGLPTHQGKARYLGIRELLI